MSGLTRTVAGLANAYRFHKVDYMIYCESDPANPLGTSCDAGYWAKVFKAFLPSKSIKLNPVGGRDNVIEIAAKLEGITGHRTMCVVDRDYSDLHGAFNHGPHVLCTRGYSIENDLTDPDILLAAIAETLPGPIDEVGVGARIHTSTNDLVTELRWLVAADQISSFYSVSVIPRKENTFRKLFEYAGADGPARLHRPRAMQAVVAARKACKGRVAIAAVRIDRDTRRRAFGHMLLWLTFRFCRKVLRELGHSQNLSEMSFLGNLISRFGEQIRDPANKFYLYYRPQVSAAELCAR